MAVAIRGVAVAWGLSSGFVAAGTGIIADGAAARLKPQSLEFDAESESQEIQNYEGNTVCKVFFNQKQLLKINDIVPTADTIANAKLCNIIPTPGAIITITDPDDTELTGTNSGKYLLVKASKKRSNKDAPRLNFELEQWVDNDLGIAPS